MKYKFINYGLFGTILVFLVVLGCKEDDFYYKNQSSEQGIKIKKVSLDDIMKKSEHREFKQPFMEFKEKISLKNNQNIQGKLIYNEEYGFYIDDENGMFIEKEGYQSYTFRIKRSESEEKLENIVFTSKSGGIFETVIVKYNITYDELEELGIDEVRNRYAEYYSYNYQTEMLPSLICTQFWVLQQVPPDQGNNVGISHGESIVYDGMWVLLSEDCSWVGGGPGSGGHGIGTGGGTGSGGNGTGTGGGGSNNGGGSGSGNNNTAIITTPIGKTPNNPNPCAPLAELFDEDKQNLSHYIDELVALHQQSTENEVSYSFSKKKIGWDEDNNRYIFSNYQALYTLGSTTSVKTQIGYATDGQIYYSCIHLHPKQEGPAAGIFSWGDIKLLRDLYLSLKDVMYVAESNDISLMVVAPDPQNIHNHNVYAVTVKNYTNLVNALKLEDDIWKADYPDEETRTKRINNHFGDKYVENKDNLEAYFLDAFSNYGISLFKLENNQWKELLLSSDRQNVIKKPCN